MPRARVDFLAPCGAVLMALLLVPAAFAATPPAGRNLLANPGFEMSLPGHPWMPAGWDTFPSQLGTVFFGRDTSIAHSGRYAASVANVSMRLPMWQNWSQMLVVGPELWNKDVVFSIWTRTMSLQGRGYILAQAFNDTIGRYAIDAGVPRDTAMARLHYVITGQPIMLTGWKRLYFSEEETEWVKREVRMYIPPTTNLLAVRTGIFGTGQISLDDASLVATTAATPAPVTKNLIRDPGFEEGGNAWEFSMPPFEDLRMEVDSTVAHSGRASMHIVTSDRGNLQVRSGIGQLIDGRALAGKRVRLTAWVRADSLRGVAYPGITCVTAAGDVPGPATSQESGTFDWKKITMERDVPPGCLLVGAYLHFTAPATGQIWYDDATLEVLGPAEYVKKKLPPPQATPQPEPLIR
jgi:hypothetical protein